MTTPIGKMYRRQHRMPGGVTEEVLSRIPVTYVDGLHDRWSASPEFFQHL
jgi:hypothetical protein